MIIALSLSASLVTSLLPLRTVVIMAREWQAALNSGELSNCCHQLVSSRSIRISQVLCNLQFMKSRQMQLLSHMEERLMNNVPGHKIDSYE